MVIRAVGLAAAAGARVTVTFVAAVFGLVIGSFLNVVIYRSPRGLSVVKPGSFCPACGTPLASSDNVPVLSWLVLRAKCRHCGEPISARYPAVELLTAALFGVVAFALGAHWAVPGMCALGATVLALAAIELDGMAPPAPVALIGTGVGTVLLVVAAVVDRRWWHLGGVLIGIGVAGVVAVTGSMAARRRGDGVTLWALVPAGAVMGWVGSPGAPVGVATFALVLVALSLLIKRPPRGEESRSRTVIAVASALGAGAALLGAFVAGSAVGV